MRDTLVRAAYWPGLIFAPVLFLAELSLAYALVPWACDHQRHAILHASAGVTLVAMIAILIVSWRDWRSVRYATTIEPDSSHSRAALLGMLALLHSTLFTLATLALWFTQFAVPPCLA